CRGVAHARPEMVGAEGLGYAPGQAHRHAQGQGGCRAQTCCHPASHVGGRHGLPLVSKGGNRVSTTHKSSPLRAGSNVPAGTLAMVRSSDALRTPMGGNALSTLIRQRHPNPSCGGSHPTAERTMDPARIVAESLTPRPGIREQYRTVPPVIPEAELQARLSG